MVEGARAFSRMTKENHDILTKEKKEKGVGGKGVEVSRVERGGAGSTGGGRREFEWRIRRIRHGRGREGRGG